MEFYYVVWKSDSDVNNILSNKKSKNYVQGVSHWSLIDLYDLYNLTGLGNLIPISSLNFLILMVA